MKRTQTLHRQRACGLAVISNRYAQTFPIQWPTLQAGSWSRRIFQMGLCLFLTLEACAAVSSELPTAHPTNGPLNTLAAGYRNRASGGLNNVGSNGNWWTFAPNSQTNARNLNFNSSNVNPLNNNNRANAFALWPSRASDRCLCSFSSAMTYKFDDIHKMVTLAYKQARKEERSTEAQLAFELHLEENIKALAIELYQGSWTPQPLDWFVNVNPTVREVFAPKFRDRVVSHVLFMMIAPVFERYFIFDSYSCRKGKGTLMGIQRFEHHLRGVTDNWTKEAWVLNLDISGYFMSIVRGVLYDTIWKTLDKHKNRFPDALDYDFVDYLVFTFLSRDPLEGCNYFGDPGRISLVLPEKSLRYQQQGVGIPIGDVINQLFSNIYLNPFDQYVKRQLKIRYYDRYVDDAKCAHASYGYLEECSGRMGEFLSKELSLRLHPRKTTITSALGTSYFLGAAIRPHRRYANNRTMARYKEYFSELELALADGKAIDTYKAVSVINSRLGYMSFFNEYKAIREMLSKAPHVCEMFSFTRGFKKAVYKR